MKVQRNIRLVRVYGYCIVNGGGNGLSIGSTVSNAVAVAGYGRLQLQSSSITAAVLLLQKYYYFSSITTSVVLLLQQYYYFSSITTLVVLLLQQYYYFSSITTSVVLLLQQYYYFSSITTSVVLLLQQYYQLQQHYYFSSINTSAIVLLLQQYYYFSSITTSVVLLEVLLLQQYYYFSSVTSEGIPSEVYKFASERLLTNYVNIPFRLYMLAGKLPSTLMQVVIISLLKCKYKDPADVNNYRPIATALSKVLEQVLQSRLARYLWTATANLVSKQAHGKDMAIFALKQTVDFYRNQDTPVYMCFRDANKAFDRVNHWTLAKKLLDRSVPLHIVKLPIFWYREQEFMAQWGNSLSMTFR